MRGMNVRIEAAPMQGYTDGIFRSVYAQCFPGAVDRAYTPFLDLERGDLRPRDRRELAVAAGEAFEVTPQIVAASPEQAVALQAFVSAAGFDAINLNLGCPYPMVTRRRKGAGALPHPALVESLLGALFEGAPMRVSIKSRLGLQSPREFEALIPILNRFALEKVILHPRTATQLYDGAPNWDAFADYGRALTAPVIANGDIRSAADAARILERFPFIDGIMAGRGILCDPLLPFRIRGLPISDAPGMLKTFHDRLLAADEGGRSPSHLLDKMTAFWRYFSAAFPCPDKAYKKIKKSKTLNAYRANVEEVFETVVQ